MEERRQIEMAILAHIPILFMAYIYLFNLSHEPDRPCDPVVADQQIGFDV
jgi:hypothetical protein